MRVLIIDDDEATRDAVGAVLDAEGYEVVGAADGREALDLLESEPLPDVILLDLMMPVMSGWHFLEEVRARRPSLRSIPLVVVSAASDELLAATGARAIVRKPLNLDRLLRLLQEIGGAEAAASLT